MVQYSITSTETRRLVRTESPGRPPRLSHTARELCATNVVISSFIECMPVESLFPPPFPNLVCECVCGGGGGEGGGWMGVRRGRGGGGDGRGARTQRKTIGNH